MGGADTGGAGGGGGTGANEIQPVDLYPLAVGNSWTFSVTPPNIFCPDGTETLSVVDLAPYEGRDAYQLTDSCDPGAVSYLTIVEDHVEQWGNGTWQANLSPPLQTGFMWQFNGRTLQWTDVGNQVVPAGTFDHCWDRSIVGEGMPAQQTTYCAGVGPVSGYFVESDVQLVSYTLQ
jgi:hypothetical protein